MKNKGKTKPLSRKASKMTVDEAVQGIFRLRDLTGPTNMPIRDMINYGRKW